jgi:hypothetical protein
MMKVSKQLFVGSSVLEFRRLARSLGCISLRWLAQGGVHALHCLPSCLEQPFSQRSILIGL